MSNTIEFSRAYSFSNNNFSILTDKNETFNIEEINQILKTYNFKKIFSIFEYYSLFFNSINFDNNFPTSSFLSKKMKYEYLLYLKSEIKKSDLFLCSYFKNILPVRIKLLKNLYSLFLDSQELTIPTYRHDTKTGRSRITSGTNYLTMKKQKRFRLKTHEKKLLYEIDFSSCEPMFYFNFLGVKIENVDLYEKIKNDLSISIDRKKLKLTIISILYGAGYETVKRTSKINRIEYHKIKSYLKIKDFLKKINKKNNVVYNFYGRPLLDTNEKNIINHWVQSSVADYVYLSFFKYSKKIKSFMLHAVIHDAMIFSIKKNDFNVIENTKFLSESISNFKIPVKIQLYTDN